MKFLVLILFCQLTACEPAQELRVAEPPRPPIENPDSPNSNSMVITIGDTRLSATLVDNAASRAFKASLPLSLTMHDMNDNEKYATLNGALPTSATNVNSISSGDIMLFGSSTIVVFYKNFPTSYSYTRIGRIDNASSLAEVVGRGSVNIKFEL